MIKLVEKLNYYNDCYEKGQPVVSDKIYDDLYFELVKKERLEGYTLPNSPTQTLRFPAVSELNKVKHNHLMLSLEKTKSPEDVISFIKNEEIIAMAKLDGLTCSLSYSKGRLVRAETRGDGFEGEDIFHNARVISSIPKLIDYEGELTIDGEIISTFKDFSSFASEYKNPRNFAAGSIRLLDPKECSRRNLTFIAWEVKKGFEDLPYLSSRLNRLEKFGFKTVPYVIVIPSTFDFDKTTKDLLEVISGTGFPIDGLVFKFNNIEYGESLGRTAHHFRNAIAYKFYDETYDTELKTIEWTMGRTGILTPVAVFTPIEIDGTIVERANLHNINVLRDTLGPLPHKGQKLQIYKSNMIIPQVYSADKEKKDNSYYISHTILNVPNLCPYCQNSTEIIATDGSQILICTNPSCDSKLINRLDHFCGKKGLDIKGISKATLSTLIEKGWISNLYDIFGLKEHKEEWISIAGFGKKSVENALEAIENAKETDLISFISSLGIPLIGPNVAKDLGKKFNSYEEFREAVDNNFDFSQLDGFAENKTKAILTFNFEEADKIFKLLKIKKKEKIDTEEQILTGKTVVVTGKLNHFKNRNELQDKIVALGGKLSNNISNRTFCLINNDVFSTSSKNKFAKQVNIPILTEEEFIEKYLTF